MASEEMEKDYEWEEGEIEDDEEESKTSWDGKYVSIF